MSRSSVLTLREAVTTYEATRPVTCPDGQEVTGGAFVASLTDEEADLLIYWQGNEEGIGIYQAEGEGTDRLLCRIHWGRRTKGGQA